jgi:flagellar biosynthesis GTPase FlhF
MSLLDESERSDITEESYGTDFTPLPVVQSRIQQQQQKQQHHRCVEAQTSCLRYGEETYDCTYIFANDTTPIKPGSRKKNYNVKTTCCILSLCVVCLVAMCFLLVGSRSDHASAAQLKAAEDARNELVQAQERLLLQLAKDRRLPTENTDLLQHNVTLLQEELERTTASLKEEQARRKEVEREAKEAWEHYEEATSQVSDVEIQMQEDMSRLYLTLANDHFGLGPHYAEFEVRVPSPGDGQAAVTRYFTVETTPIEHMPASVFLFLQQVDHKLWDGTSFHINAPHVLLAQPLSSSHHHHHENNAHYESPFAKMQRMGMARVPFVEINEEYPHTAYTLGYGGAKLPGPNFYINKVDNVHHHQSEPCFAKVIIGYDTVDLIGQLTGPVDNPYYIQQPVDIVRVRLVDDLTEVHGGTEYLNFIAGHDEH